MSYTLKFTNQANTDVRKVTTYIKEELYEPGIAEQFLRGVYARIKDLEENASIYSISMYQDVLAYGDNARHIMYKGFVIIYTIHGDIVLIHRIIHGSLIRG